MIEVAELASRGRLAQCPDKTRDGGSAARLVSVFQSIGRLAW